VAAARVETCPGADGQRHALESADKKSEMKTTVPTEEDWGDYQSDLDQEWAYKLFAGHTNEEMQPHYRANVIERTAVLRSMPEKPFRYYMIGFRDFLMAADFEHPEASDAASCFLNLVLQKLEQYPRCISPIMPDLIATVDYIAQNQSAFDADKDIYGDFLELSARIHALNAARRDS
jgi:hypothetical protein